jgi:hypothetical protein
MPRIVQYCLRIWSRVSDHRDKHFAALAEKSPWIAANMKTTARWNGWLIAYVASPMFFFMAIDVLSSEYDSDLWAVLLLAMGIFLFKFGRYWKRWGKTPIKGAHGCSGDDNE